MSEEGGASQQIDADRQYLAGAVDLLGILAYGALTAFERMAETPEVRRRSPTRSRSVRSPPDRSTISNASAPGSPSRAST